MKKVIFGILMLLPLMGLIACTEGFPDEEMHLGLEDKVRPYAIIIEPPEAAPGETVEVTLLARVPDIDELDISWRVAMDYSVGLYEADEVERNFRYPQDWYSVTDVDGFLVQSFNWVVPDSALLYASDIPEILTDPAMIYLAEQLMGPEAGSPPTKSAVDAWLKDVSLVDMMVMDPLEREAVWALSDRFASQVRFRVTMQTGSTVDVTRNLTIRHTERLDGPNANHNPFVFRYKVVAVEMEDATADAINDPAIPQTSYTFIETYERQAHKLEIPLHEQWTYFMSVIFSAQYFTPPFDPTLVVLEASSYRWYYYRQDDPLSDHQFFLNDSGDETEMFSLDENVRIMPDGVGSTFRVLSVGRDVRLEWVMYNAVPGLVVEEGIVEFVEP